MKKTQFALSFVLLTPSVFTQAALIDHGNGLLSDTVQNVTWLQDANLVKTSCDANNALWQAFDPLALPLAQRSGNTKQEICDGLGGNAGGQLNWYEAGAWVALLNAQNYLGYNDWRLPNVVQPDASCSDTDGNGQNYGYRCTGSEFGHLFAAPAPAGLGNPNNLDDNCHSGGSSPFCLQNTGLFNNMQSEHYFTGADYTPLTTNAWSFRTDFGFLGNYSKVTRSFYVLALRSGQVAQAPARAVPAMGGLGLALMSLLTLLLAGRRGRLFK
ncbi:MAG: DUF1566 domain-containing protein [Cellvibrionaceae bacterium]|nr:DUF1566 domain-containing protein [Cellvibrionaceae bacterium]MCV6625917.1 DUF1566 domain-containing protein [Cellvibrionaceae bacterium]